MCMRDHPERDISSKLVHNGIEFGMLQAMAEGFDLLTHYHDRLDIASVLECWRHGSVIRSWLLDLLTQAYREDPKLRKPSSYVEDTGEVNWLVSDAIGHGSTDTGHSHCGHAAHRITRSAEELGAGDRAHAPCVRWTSSRPRRSHS